MPLHPSRDTDVRVALALGWRWERLPGGLQLLTPPDGTYFYDPSEGGLQLVPAHSTDRQAWEDYLAEHRLMIQVTGKGAWVDRGEQGYTGATVPLALCALVLRDEERRAAYQTRADDERQPCFLVP